MTFAGSVSNRRKNKKNKEKIKCQVNYLKRRISSAMLFEILIE